MTTLPRRPRLKQTVDVFSAPGGDIYLYRGGDADFVIEGGGEAARSLLSSLDGSRALPAIAAGLGADAADAAELLEASVAQLVRLGLVEDASDDDTLSPVDCERYDRQLRYFGDAAPAGESRAGYQQKLRRAHVTVLGVGGLGGAAALALASLGVGRLTIIDSDRVELSNLNRQVLFSESDLGRAKVQAAADRLRQFHSGVEVETAEARLTGPDQIRDLVAGTDIVVDAVDTPVHEIEGWVNEACFAAKVPYIAMSQFPPRVRIGPLFAPGATGCYACQEAAWRDRYPLFDALGAHRRARPSPAAALGPTSLLIGAQVATEVMYHLTGLKRPTSLGRSVVIDVESMEVELTPVVRVRDCEVCGQSAPTA